MNGEIRHGVYTHNKWRRYAVGMFLAGATAVGALVGVVFDVFSTSEDNHFQGTMTGAAIGFAVSGVTLGLVTGRTPGEAPDFHGNKPPEDNDIPSED